MRFNGRSQLGLAVLAALGIVVPVACATESDSSFETAPEGSTSTDTGHGTGGLDDPGCEGPLGPPQDPSSLPTCCAEGAPEDVTAVAGAHCVADVPDIVSSALAPCDSGGFCVPDPFIKSGGVFTPKACDAFDGSAGVCLSGCIPQVANVAGILEQDVCDTGERCAPCVFSGSPTGACDIKFTCESSLGGTGGGPAACDDPTTCEYDCPTPALDPSVLPPCPNLCGGHCVPNAQVPDPSFLSQLEACDASSVCVPDTFIVKAGKLTPPTCKSVGGFEGRCLSTCLPAVSEQAAQLPKDTCGDGELCTPCYDPLTGDDTGACKVSCDKGPAGPAQTFQKCCPDGKGLCVPAGSIPPDQQDKLGNDTCPQDAGAQLCVPDPFLEAQQSGQPFFPQSCETSFWLQFLFGSEYASGACLPECIPEVADAPFVTQGECPDAWKCVPCQTPPFGGDSGACGPQGG